MNSSLALETILSTSERSDAFQSPDSPAPVLLSLELFLGLGRPFERRSLLWLFFDGTEHHEKRVPAILTRSFEVFVCHPLTAKPEPNVEIHVL